MKGPVDIDPKGLISEAYRIEGITAAECRSIFLDWALSLADGQETGPALHLLIARHGETNADHPMTRVLQDGVTGIATPKRRGGWKSRPRS